MRNAVRKPKTYMINFLYIANKWLTVHKLSKWHGQLNYKRKM